jgi:hypothetical protein
MIGDTAFFKFSNKIGFNICFANEYDFIVIKESISDTDSGASFTATEGMI